MIFDAEHERLYTFAEVRRFTEEDWISLHDFCKAVTWGGNKFVNPCVAITYMSRVTGKRATVPALKRCDLREGMYSAQSTKMSFIRPEVDVDQWIGAVLANNGIPSSARIMFGHAQNKHLHNFR